ncbi:acetate--CoA ligase family protein [Aliamphritea spongicola]|uniref:acetate--CoA ligase family protein n=1 Tax=Aliamphritea spongicola TaxID=707589 RepID=UPI00196AD775|nr:acetate--CoA ligase family protein [Aliamphritea spongicola]
MSEIDKSRFARLLKPRSIVVFGGAGARYAIVESQKLGFDGEIWAVHPSHSEMAGVKCYPSIADLPGVPDAAYVAVNAEAAMEIVGQLSEIGCGGAVLYASGFAEVGEEGAERQRLLVERAGSMPMIGPNCYGVLNCLDKAVLWPDQHGSKAVDKGVAVITQSGNIGLNITMQRRGLPLAFMFTMGNQANVGVADVMDALLDDPRITAIGLHIEGLSDIHHFDAVCRRALEKRIPVVAAKNGRSEAAAKIAMSHTSSLTGSDKLFDALFKRLGIARVDTLEELIETLKLVAIAGPLKGNRVASMSCSGGEAGVMADLIERHDLTFPAMTSEHQAQVRETLSEYVVVENPLDYHTFIWGDEARKTATFSAMMSAGYDATMLLLDWPSFADADPAPWNAAMHGLINASQATGHQGILLASLPECLPQAAIDTCVQAGVVPMIGLDTCLRALSAAYQIGLKHQQPAPLPLLHSAMFDDEQAGRNIDEYQGKQALAGYGLQIPAGELVSNADEAVSCAERIGYPVVIKAVSDTIVHKTEQGAVQLFLQSAEDVRDAVSRMAHLSDAFLVEQMLTETVGELLIGVTRDQQFGPSLVIGSGGIMVELLKDSATLLLPVTETDVREAITGLKMFPLLSGFRGKQAGDIDACVNAVMAVAEYASQRRDTLLELDINPLLVAPEGSGAYAADAYIRIGKE